MIDRGADRGPGPCARSSHDPEGHHDWAIVATVDLDASDAAGEPVIRTQSFGDAGQPPSAT